MKGCKNIIVLFVFLFIYIPSVSYAWIYPISKNSPGFEITQDFLDYLGCYNGTCYNGYHLGEDINTANDRYFTEPVYAISEGAVTYSQDYRENNQDPWGYVIIIQHESLVGDVCSLYGHLYENYDMPQVGDYVSENEQIGIIGNADGRYSAHLHFEIIDCENNPELADNPGVAYVSRSNDEIINRYFDPSDFIEEREERKDETAINDTLDRAIYENRHSYYYFFIEYSPNSLIFDDNWSATWELRSVRFVMRNFWGNRRDVRIYHALHRNNGSSRFTAFYNPFTGNWDGWIYWENL